MRYFLMPTASTALALSMIAAPLAIAQSNPHPQGPQMSTHSNEVHATGPQHPVQQGGLEHSNATHTMANNTMPHQMTQVSHEQQHSGPAPMQHSASYGGHQWHHGDHYTGGRNYVSNWNSYRLSPPPSGYEWVQDGSQFVLIAVATGIISSVILNAQ